jgi:hypothetical protein
VCEDEGEEDGEVVCGLSSMEAKVEEEPAGEESRVEGAEDGVSGSAMAGAGRVSDSGVVLDDWPSCGGVDIRGEDGAGCGDVSEMPCRARVRSAFTGSAERSARVRVRRSV